eukprot:scaffold77653_cov30-Tisochrysis_lutea.AAC.1
MSSLRRRQVVQDVTAKHAFLLLSPCRTGTLLGGCTSSKASVRTVRAQRLPHTSAREARPPLVEKGVFGWNDVGSTEREGLAKAKCVARNGRNADLATIFRQEHRLAPIEPIAQVE